jgi:PEP-CTERM motif-containing protein
MYLGIRLASIASAIALGALLFASAPAGATPIGPSCGTCQGSIYEISTTTTPLSSTLTTQTWRITYTIDTTGYNGGGTHLDSVALKVSSALLAATLVSAPGGVGQWVETLGGINAGGCSGSGGGFDCAEATSVGTSPVVPGSTYTWIFDLTMSTGGLLTGTGQSTVKARYVDDAGSKVGALVSEGITLTIVPEPSTAVLLVIGGTLLGARRRR